MSSLSTVHDDPDLAMILADMQIEYVETTQDRLAQVDQAIAALLEGIGNAENHVLEIKRMVHTIKGTASSFGFPTISMLAHSLEDYFETAGDLGENELYDVQLYVDRMREIIDDGENPDEVTAGKIIRGLPSKPKSVVDHMRVGETTVLMVMQRGVQRKIIGRELASFGFRVVIAEDTLEAVKLGMIMRPEIIITAMHVTPFTGAEMAGVMASIKATQHANILLVTASDDDVDLADLPPNVTVGRKGPTFSLEFFNFLKNHGLN